MTNFTTLFFLPSGFVTPHFPHDFKIPSGHFDGVQKGHLKTSSSISQAYFSF